MKNSKENIKKRRDELIVFLSTQEYSTISELSERFNVSEMTIRRDCQILKNMNIITQHQNKLYYIDKSNDTDHHQQNIMNNKISRTAANYVKDEQMLFINSSSVAIHSLNYLSDKQFTLLTNNISAIDFKRNPKSTYLLSGGEISFERNIMTGDLAYDSFNNIQADIAIIGCSGISLDKGLSTSKIYEARINQKIIENANQVILVTDYSKLGKSSNFKIANLSQIDIIITDNFSDPTLIKEIEDLGITVVQLD
ncbi:DeoR/GlpR family DNA-binding transcription regulator [Ligilactobacillus ceti]|uniref:Transcriptional regulator n=1 Tax=Ligilactobacillus ceti DSM 22408 TaxID=1122146 RepID=A0A0R2KVC7_9LACO|nr:DeoR/GlpR family DNA-binding transcription regulator [Ligilactobacillus ceti]KRN90343.1 transcriptional regulator [Ligilactobacillus ceti DSM 22408]